MEASAACWVSMGPIAVGVYRVLGGVGGMGLLPFPFTKLRFWLSVNRVCPSPWDNDLRCYFLLSEGGWFSAGVTESLRVEGRGGAGHGVRLGSKPRTGHPALPADSHLGAPGRLGKGAQWGGQGPGAVDHRAHVTPLCCLLRGGRGLQGGRTPLSFQALCRETWTNKQTPQESLALWTFSKQAAHQFPWLGCAGEVSRRGGLQPAPGTAKDQSKQNLDHAKGGLALRGWAGGPEEGSPGEGGGLLQTRALRMQPPCPHHQRSEGPPGAGVERNRSDPQIGGGKRRPPPLPWVSPALGHTPTAHPLNWVQVL